MDHSSVGEIKGRPGKFLERLIDDNERFIKGFKEAGEQVILIDEDYEKAIWNLL